MPATCPWSTWWVLLTLTLRLQPPLRNDRDSLSGSPHSIIRNLYMCFFFLMKHDITASSLYPVPADILHITVFSICFIVWNSINVLRSTDDFSSKWLFFRNLDSLNSNWTRSAVASEESATPVTFQLVALSESNTICRTSSSWFYPWRFRIPDPRRFPSFSAIGKLFLLVRTTMNSVDCSNFRWKLVHTRTEKFSCPSVWRLSNRHCAYTFGMMGKTFLDDMICPVDANRAHNVHM